MTDLLLKLFVEVSDNSEMRFGAIASKLIFYFNCIVLTFWIANGLGYPLDNFDSQPLQKLLAHYYAIIPLFIYIFTCMSFQIVSNLITSLAKLLMSIYFTHVVFDGQTFKEYWKSIEKKIIDDEEPQKKHKSFRKFVLGIKKDLKTTRPAFTYYCLSLVSIIFIYSTIIPMHFPSLHYTWICVLLWVTFVIYYCAVASMVFIEEKAKEAKSMLQKMDMHKLVSHSQPE
jgi:hypothetical protein